MKMMNRPAPKISNWTETVCVFGIVLMASACVPEPLEGFDDAGVTPANNGTGTDMGNPNNGGTTGANNGGTGTFNPEFLAVTAIVRQNCLLGGCHGNPPGAVGVFTVPTGMNATDAEIQTALSNSIPGSQGNRLVAPGDPNTSEIYLRVSKPAGDPLLMGAASYGAAGVPLAATEITAIQTWIANGAIYTQ